MALSVERHNPGVSRQGRGMASRSSFSDPRTGAGIERDFRGDRKWLHEGPSGGGHPLWKRALGFTEWGKEERKRSKIALKQFRIESREFEKKRQEAERKWNKEDFPELKKDVYYKWGIPGAKETAERHKEDLRYQNEYQNRLKYAEDELEKITKTRIENLQKEKYAMHRQLEDQLKGRRQEESKSMLDEWHARRR